MMKDISDPGNDNTGPAGDPRYPKLFPWET